MAEFEPTKAEFKVLAAFAAGLTIGDVAAALGISVHTVRHQRQAALKRLGAHTLAQAIYLACKEGVL